MLNLRYPKSLLATLVAAVSVMICALPADAQPGPPDHSNSKRPQKTPGLSLALVAALSTAGYAGYQRFKKGDDQ